MNAKGRHQHIKMKPPWRARGRRPLQVASCCHPAVIRAAAALVLLLAAAPATICDQHRQAAVSNSRVHHHQQHQSSGRVLGADEEAPLIGEHATRQGHEQTTTGSGGDGLVPAAGSPTAHFNMEKMSPFVTASSYQTEVYLPCQVLNLDDDQTVSWLLLGAFRVALRVGAGWTMVCTGAPAGRRWCCRVVCRARRHSGQPSSGRPAWRRRPIHLSL
jgi:hypothetical protein